jgi:hypothetical protein
VRAFARTRQVRVLDRSRDHGQVEATASTRGHSTTQNPHLLPSFDGRCAPEFCDDQRIMSGDCYQQSVLINDTESVERPEQVCPSLASLKTPDEIERLLAGTSYVTLKSGFKTFLILEDRERCEFRRSSPVAQDHLPSKMIEAGTQGVNSVSQENRNPNRRRGT